MLFPCLLLNVLPGIFRLDIISVLNGCHVCAAEPSASGLQENDYPVLSDDRIGLAALREIGSVKRLPLPAELAERFACILQWQLFVVVVFTSNVCL